MTSLRPQFALVPARKASRSNLRLEALERRDVPSGGGGGGFGGFGGGFGGFGGFGGGDSHGGSGGSTTPSPFGQPGSNPNTGNSTTTGNHIGPSANASSNSGPLFQGFGRGSDCFATGAEHGGGPQVNLYQQGNQVGSFFAYSSSYTGGVRVAVGDVNGDGVKDVITVTAAGGGPEVKVFDGATGQVTQDFFAFDPSFTGGMYVASGDVNNDGFDDIVVSADAGGGPEVKVFSGQDGSKLLDFFAFEPGFTGGVRLAVGDVNGDGFADIVVTPGVGGGPRVSVYSGKDASVLVNFFAYAPSFTSGMFVACGDFDGDGKMDIVTGAGSGGGPHVRVLRGFDGAELENFFAYETTFTGGVSVAAADADGDGQPDVVCTPGAGGSSLVRAFRGHGHAPIFAMLAYGNSFHGGTAVAGSAGQNSVNLSEQGTYTGTLSGHIDPRTSSKDGTQLSPGFDYNGDLTVNVSYDSGSKLWHLSGQVALTRSPGYSASEGDWFTSGNATFDVQVPSLRGPIAFTLSGPAIPKSAAIEGTGTLSGTTFQGTWKLASNDSTSHSAGSGTFTASKS